MPPHETFSAVIMKDWACKDCVRLKVLRIIVFVVTCSDCSSLVAPPVAVIWTSASGTVPCQKFQNRSSFRDLLQWQIPPSTSGVQVHFVRFGCLCTRIIEWFIHFDKICLRSSQEGQLSAIIEPLVATVHKSVWLVRNPVFLLIF